MRKDQFTTSGDTWLGRRGPWLTRFTR
jgi:hypothetical protein